MTILPIRKFIIMVVFSFGWLLAVDTQVGYACGGGAPLNVEGLISNSDYVVKAHAIEQDDTNQNVILQVESYLVGGSGPEFLLLNRTEPVLVEYILNSRSSGADCLGLSRKLGRSVSIYLFLSRNDDGSYSRTSYNLLYIFDSLYSTLSVNLEDSTEREVTEYEFVDFIAQKSGETPTTPDPSYRYPLKSPLLIQTQSKDYMVPVDWQTPILVTKSEFQLSDRAKYLVGVWDAGKCFVEGCTRISPDRMNVAVINADNTISFSRGNVVDGQELLFASTSDAVAVWDDCDINIYTTGYPRLNQEWYELELVNNLSLDAENCEQYHAVATWTPDGRQLAYSDDGIWLWDVYSINSQPRLLVPIESSISLIPNYFSPLGRYLNFSRDDVRKHLDIVSGEVIADGSISPDDRLLINYEQSNGSYGYQICSLDTQECKYGWDMLLMIYDESTGKVTKGYQPSLINKVAWQNKYSFLQVACVENEPEICAVFGYTTTFDGWYAQQFGRGFDFAYDNDQDIIAILKDAHTISIRGVELDTSQWFDEEIISIEWLPSLFYYED